MPPVIPSRWHTGVGIRYREKTDCHNRSADRFRNDRERGTDCHANAAALARNDTLWGLSTPWDIAFAMSLIF